MSVSDTNMCQTLDIFLYVSDTRHIFVKGIDACLRINIFFSEISLLHNENYLSNNGYIKGEISKSQGTAIDDF